MGELHKSVIFGDNSDAKLKTDCCINYEYQSHRSPRMLEATNAYFHYNSWLQSFPYRIWMPKRPTRDDNGFCSLIFQLVGSPLMNLKQNLRMNVKMNLTM